MKKVIAFLLLLLFIILAWFSWSWYKNNILCCNDTTNNEKVEETKKIIPEAVKYGPLVYDWNSSNAITNDLWPAKKKEILSGFADGKILRIVGPYFAEETNNTTFDNLGLARADAVRKLLLDSIATEKMEIAGKLADFTDDVKTKSFEGTVLLWVVRNENIQEIDNKALIYFPYNSTKKLDNANINKYLVNVAKTLKGNDKKVTLTGHTDNIGNADFNKKLGLKRALSLKNILISLGVEAHRITVASKGQEQPIDTNDTEKGRQKNRRVELEINETH